MQKLKSDFINYLAKTYDQQPYFSNVFPWSAPGYLRAGAYLYGINTAPVTRARILELGCAAGGNCIPIASLYPEVQLVGVDISANQIAMGKRVIKAMGLTNIQLIHGCFSQLPKSLGQFDYIIAHGVWSWIPKAAQSALLRVCQNFLAPKGLAYISFNTYPGWKLQEVFRDAMLFHGQQHKEQEQVARAREMLSFFQQGLATENPMHATIKAQAEKVPEGPENDYYIAHEYLELHNHPIYLKDFVRQLDAFGLAYVGDAEARNELPSRYGAKFAQYFNLFTQGQSNLARQQYLDFAIGRQFRKALIMHRDSISEEAPAVDLSRLSHLQFAGWFEQEGQNLNAYQQPVVSFYRNLQDKKLRITEPLHDLWLNYLHESWPRPVSGQDLLRLAKAQHPELEIERLKEQLKLMYLNVPLNLCRSYEDLPPCLHDLSQGLIPGIAALITARHQQQTEPIEISDFNAWFQSSTAVFDDVELLMIQGLDKNTPIPKLVWQLVQHMEQATPGSQTPNQVKQATKIHSCGETSTQWAEQKIDAFIAHLRKYALYI